MNTVIENLNLRRGDWTSYSWLVFQIHLLIQQIYVECQYQGLEMKCNAKIRLLFLPSWSFRSYGRDPHEYGYAILINQKEKA